MRVCNARESVGMACDVVSKSAAGCRAGRGPEHLPGQILEVRPSISRDITHTKDLAARGFAFDFPKTDVPKPEHTRPK